MANLVRRAADRVLDRTASAVLRSGVPARHFRYRWLQKVPVEAQSVEALGGTYEVLAPSRQANHPLPITHGSTDQLSSDPDWFGYAQADVPTRKEGETAIATLPDVRLAFHTDEKKDVWVGLLDNRDRALTLREIVARPHHAAALRGQSEQRRQDGVWICERVYHNHSHWLTAHLPKLLLVKQLGLVDRLVMPERQTEVMKATMRHLGIDPGSVATLPLGEVAGFDSLTVLKTDRFRGDLLRPVRDALAPSTSVDADARVFISRAGSKGRQLVGEDKLLPILARYGFEIVQMEELSWSEQLALMQRTKVLVGPHGAGLTNMMFCPPGATIIEIADPLYPNPNFYALACAMAHAYGLVPARSVGENGHRLYRDLELDPSLLETTLELACR